MISTHRSVRAQSPSTLNCNCLGQHSVCSLLRKWSFTKAGAEVTDKSVFKKNLLHNFDNFLILYFERADKRLLNSDSMKPHTETSIRTRTFLRKMQQNNQFWSFIWKKKKNYMCLIYVSPNLCAKSNHLVLNNISAAFLGRHHCGSLLSFCLITSIVCCR